MAKGTPKNGKGRSIPPSRWWRTQPNSLTRLRSGHIVTSDALEALHHMRDGIADVVFLDPPFNLGKSYGKATPKDDRKIESEYSSFMTDILRESTRVLRRGGSLFLYHIPKRMVQFLPQLDRDLSFRHWIAIGMKNGFVRSDNLYPAHYALVHFSKGRPAILQRPKIPPSACPHCGELIRDYGGYLEHVADGVNLSDFWDDISPVRHSKYKYRAENELPMIVVKRIVEIAGERGGLLVDVFSGTGGAAVAARKKGMRYIAIDKEPENCGLILDRMEETTKRRKARDS